MTVLIPDSATRCVEQNPRPRDRAMYQAACDAAAADPDERRPVREFNACTLCIGMVVWYDGQFRHVVDVECPRTPGIVVRPEVTVSFLASATARLFWFPRRLDPVYCLVDDVVTPC